MRRRPRACAPVNLKAAHSRQGRSTCLFGLDGPALAHATLALALSTSSGTTFGTLVRVRGELKWHVPSTSSPTINWIAAQCPVRSRWTGKSHAAGRQAGIVSHDRGATPLASMPDIRGEPSPKQRRHCSKPHHRCNSLQPSAAFMRNTAPAGGRLGGGAGLHAGNPSL